MRQLIFWLKKNWPLIFVFVVVFVFFWQFFLKNLLPIPADIIPGIYFPWYDQHFSSSPYGIPVKNNVLSDVVSIMYPWRKLVIDQLKMGLIPLWNPHILSGSVLLANFQSVPFYPLNILYWIVPDFAKAWAWQIILQPLLAWIFMYIFLKNNKLSNIASVFGSSTWAFSGFFSVWLEYNTIVHASLYFPLILYSIQKSIENKNFYILIALAVSSSFYSGYPQITLYELLFTGLFTVVVLHRLFLKQYIAFIFYIFLGIGLSLPFLLPGYEAARLSIRQVDNVANTSHVKFALPEQIITFMAPDYFGNPVSRNYWLIGGTYENAIIFAGTPAFILFLFSFMINKKRRSKLLYYSWIISFLAVLLIFKNPISMLLGNSNILLFSASVMGRFSMILTFGIAIASALGVDEFIKYKINQKSLLIPLIIPLLLVSVYGIFGFITHNTVSLRNLVLPSSIYLTCALLLWSLIYNKLKKYKLFVIGFFIVLEIIDLYRFHNKYNPFISSEFLYPKNLLTDFLLSQNPERFESESGQIIPPNMWMPYDLYSASGQDAVGSLRYNKFLGFINTGKFVVTDRYVSITNYDSNLFDFLGIKNVAGIKWKNGAPDFEGTISAKFSDPKFQKVFDNGRTVVLENLSRTVILEEIPKQSFSKTNTKIENVNFDANLTSAEITSTSSAMVVLTQSHFPGWNAYIDGVKTHLYRADYDFMAIIVPDGKHEVVIKYEPLSFKLGLIGGGISLFLFLVSFIYLNRKNIPQKRS